MFRSILLSTLLVITPLSAQAQTAQLDPMSPEVGKLIHQAALGTSVEVKEALDILVANNIRSAIPSIIVADRYRNIAVAEYREALQALTGNKELTRWYDWMLWQEANPDAPTHPVYHDIKLEFLVRIDPAFLRFLGPSNWDPQKADIRLEEVTWGGVRVDGIPALDDGPWVDRDKADYLNDEDLVFGVAINGDARAYPLRILGWHEMANDVIGGVPVSLAYCTLCGAAILFEGSVKDVGLSGPLTFGSTGMLYRSNKLMYDRETDSVWNQFTGAPVAGPLAGKGIELKVGSVVTTTWAAWKLANPTTKVIDIHTGFNRDYGAGVVYRDYFSSPDLMFPTITDETRLQQKQRVFGLRGVGASKAWSLTLFDDADVVIVNDSVGPDPVVLIGNNNERTVRAYERKGLNFATGDDGVLKDQDGGIWLITETALKGPNGETLGRLPGHLAFWFAWNSYFGATSELVTEISQ